VGLWNPPASPTKRPGWNGSDYPHEYRLVGKQHRNRSWAPKPRRLRWQWKGCMSHVTWAGMEPCNKNIPITTHAPSRPQDLTPLNEPHPTIPKACRQMETSSNASSASLGTKCVNWTKSNNAFQPHKPIKDTNNLLSKSKKLSFVGWNKLIYNKKFVIDIIDWKYVQQKDELHQVLNIKKVFLLVFPSPDNTEPKERRLQN